MITCFINLKTNKFEFHGKYILHFFKSLIKDDKPQLPAENKNDPAEMCLF